MTINIDHLQAKKILFKEYQNSLDNIEDTISIEWTGRIERLTELCPYRKSSTFVAALGTAMLAKTIDPGVDVYCLLERDGSDTSYSARSLADNVWAKSRALLGIDLGANGANPLNNTPFIGKARIDEIRNVRNKNGYAFLIECLNLLATYTTTDDAKSALRGFINVRRNDFQSVFSVGEEAGDYLVLPTLIDAVEELMKLGSEEGRIAQSVASGCLAVLFGSDNIDVGHVNDPDRNFPLDIAIHSPSDSNSIRIAVEVKDKPVGSAEILSSIEKAKSLDVDNVVFLAVSNRQVIDQYIEVYERARDMGCKLSVYFSWEEFIKSCITFSSDNAVLNMASTYQAIGNYLTELGVSQNAVSFWEGKASSQNST
ncbi:restriction endonuclease, SacI family [Aliidiomarina minuta]|uniref:Restriction endonuclease, SacI family n=1 Tax=Aliidiomarina minuta TaxID=880057 RepID=A0A432W4M8_9GAMM|nr:restriction endonuclease, SacI family [Aliidiomarina minuta]RUO24462.1 restriction endonuclease, SacI family [Aliidiomarina minuta]